jgi:diguanylate cyclase (GGDEF)-like protein
MARRVPATGDTALQSAVTLFALMTSFDLRSLNLITGLMSVVLGIVLLGMRRQLPATIHGLLQWGIAPLLCAASALAYSLDGRIAAVAVTLSGNGLLLAGSYLYYFGSQRFYGVPTRWRFWMALMAGCLVVISVFQLLVPDYRFRLACFTGTMAAIMLAHARLLLQKADGFAARFTARVLLAEAAVLLVRGAATFWVDAPDTTRFTAVSGIHTVYIGAFSFAAMLVSVGVQFMAAEQVHKEFEHLANHDSLTGILTRRAQMQLADYEMHRWQRYGKSFCLLMLDIDYFKRINDQYGHLVGDRVLVRFAAVVKKQLRESDVLGRYGGEEFMVLLPSSDAAAAHQVAERIRAAVEQQVVGADNPACTTSIGLACVQSGDTQLEDLLARADAALYRAKAQGRNRVQQG